MKTRLLDFSKEEDGPTTVEYAVILALILVAIFSTVAIIGSSASGSFVDTSQTIGNFFSADGL